MPTDHRVPVTSNESLAAVHHPAPSSAWIVFCHGFISDKSGTYETRCARAVTAGYNAIRFDFRGCGDSDGRFVDQTLSTKLTDLQAIVEFFDLDRYTVFGSSFGGKVAFHAAIKDPRITAVATRAPVTFNATFDRVRAEVSKDGTYEYGPNHRIDHRFFDDLATHPFSDVIDGLAQPTAIFHGADDESVDPTDSFRAAKHLTTDVMLAKYQHEGHRFSTAAEARLHDDLFNWLTTVTTHTK